MGYRKLIQDPEPLERLEILYNDDREEVKTLDEATWKYVTLFDEEGVTEQYSVDIIDGVDQEYVDMEEAEEFDETKINREPEGSPEGGRFAKKEGMEGGKCISIKR